MLLSFVFGTTESGPEFAFNLQNLHSELGALFSAKAKARSAWMKGELLNVPWASKTSNCQKHGYF